MRNTWLWFHILGGGIAAKVFNLFMTEQLSVLAVLAGAIIWEIYEYLSDDVEKIYGSKKRFYLDAIQDIAGAVIMAIIVIL
jgi:hypothetical protein